MEALHAISVAASLSWKDSFSPSALNGRTSEAMQRQRGKAGLGSCVFNCTLSSSTLHRSLAECSMNVDGSRIPRYYLGQRRGSSVNAVASPFLTSDDDEGTHIPVRVKMLQEAVGPNKTLLDAQARVCTGPTQTRPLDEAQAFKALNTILQSGTLILLITGRPAFLFAFFSL